jgi:hypothetical protein
LLALQRADLPVPRDEPGANDDWPSALGPELPVELPTPAPPPPPVECGEFEALGKIACWASIAT